MTDIDAIFFDVDGTLVDSGKDIVKAMNYTLKTLGFPTRPAGKVVSYIGTGVKDLVKKSLGKANERFVIEGIGVFSRYYMDHSTDESLLYPHVKDTLEYFKTKRKFIVTNRYTEFADMTLKELGVRKYFEHIFGGDDESCLKPSACVLDRAMSKLKIDKKRAMIVGDMDIDINTGKNSGVKTCWVTYGLGKKADVLPLHPDFVIDDMNALKDIIR